MMQHLSRISDAVQIAIFALTALAGILIGVLEVTGFLSTTWASNIPALILSLLGLISLNLVFERVILMKRLEKLEALETEELLSSLPKETQAPIRQAVQDYVELHRSRERLRDGKTYFFEVADEIMEDQYILLKGLPQGKVNVPADLNAIAQRKLLSRFRSKFDAVSEDDLSFWLDLRSRDYFEAGVTAIKRGTRINRIFIVTVAELIYRRTDIVNVMKRQHQAGIGWGIAVSEELDSDVTEMELPRDFAILDGDKVATFFRKRGDRFEAVFNIPLNHRILNDQRMLYRNMIGECWLANTKFKDSFAEGWSQQDLEIIRKKAHASNHRLKEDLNLDMDPQADPFVLLALDAHSIDEKVQRLAEVIRDWRAKRGFDLPKSV